MSGFSADWLSLREPYDGRARSSKVLDAVAGALAAIPRPRSWIACGTGSTLRALHSRGCHVCSVGGGGNDLSLLARAAAGPFPAA